MLFRILAYFALLFAALPAYAGQPEARAVALMNNCPPKKIEVFQNSLGSTGKTLYQVTCMMPKTTDKDAAAGPDALLIACDGALCDLVRPLEADKK